MIHKSISQGALRALLLLAVAAATVAPVAAQALGSAGTVTGVITDPNGAVVPNASVTIANPVTGYTRTVNTGADGTFRFDNVPPNSYGLSVTASGFSAAQQKLDVRTSVPISLKIQLAVGGTNETVTVTSTGAGDVIENESTPHVDVDETRINRLPLRSPGSGLSEVVTLTTPGVAADSNGFYHPLGDHAQSQIVVDNQPITDQQSKAFSTQIQPSSIQSLEIINGATPAEFGEESSLVINAITKSGLNQKRPTGSLNTTYGTFGTVSQEASLGYGGPKWGNFVDFNFQRSGRFLDAPEFTVLHDRGTSGNVFDRIDYSPTSKDTFHGNLFIARNQFQIANTFEQQALGQDQHQLVHTLDFAPGYVHVFNSDTILTVSPYYRLDVVKYFPSANPFSDQTQTISQQRRLNNVGVKADVSYVKGRHNAKFGGQFQHTFLTENFAFGITDPNFNDPASPDFLPGLAPFDLTRGGQLFQFHGHTDIKQEALFAQDNITLHNLSLSLGLRFDNYNGIVHDNALEPRIGASYLVKRTNTVLRGSYTRTFERPYNENLILSSATGAGGLADGVLDLSTSNQPLRPGRRNQFNVGMQQGFGKHVIFDIDYFYKHTVNAYDFNVLLNTPVTFPISWSLSKIDGVDGRIEFTNYHGFSAFFVAGHTRARYFPPESGGLFFNSNLPAGVFRIDHDQAFQQTTQVQYQFMKWKRLAPYVDFTWRYDSGLVSGAVPDFATALTFTADEQQQIGLFCGNVVATLDNPITSCTDSNRGALRVRIPADATENDDTNPPRIAPRNLFDLSVGTDNLFRTEHTKMTARFTIINLTNKVALYNFESTFSGTHFVSPRVFQGQVGVTF
ncbi:MAG TPA: TonB-dependent receptor [Pyrinomonadaceae bacterium]|nr:TonB-dependent receptor [Pyrinomonadaceae bacterium]